MELALQNLSVSLGKKEILTSVNLTVPDGALMSLLGKSGCGKTTLLNTIAGIVPQREGSVYIDGKCVDGLPPHRRNTVIVFQDNRLFPHLNVAENIGFPMLMRGLSREEVQSTVSQLIEKVHLEGLEKRKPNQISGGQVQRVALARALAAKPNVLLLDEPFSSLDGSLRQEMRALVLDLQREMRLTTVLVTHDWQEALEMSDKIALLMDKVIIQCDTPRKIYECPLNRQVADFFGEATFIHGIVKNHQFLSEIVSFHTDQQDGAYQAMLRPSAVQLNPQGQKNYQIMEISYCGENDRIILEHLQTKTKLTAFFPSFSRFSLRDQVAILIDPSKVVLFSE